MCGRHPNSVCLVLQEGNEAWECTPVIKRVRIAHILANAVYAVDIFRDLSKQIPLL